MGNISIEGMEFFAYHGCFEEERIIGGRFMVEVTLEADTRAAEESDELSQTVNYQSIYELVKKEMNVKAKLLEHLARRIARAVTGCFPEISGLTVKVSKLNPPLGGKVERVSVTVHEGSHHTLQT